MIFFRISSVLFVPMLLAACAHKPQPLVSDTPSASGQGGLDQIVETSQPKLPSVPLTDELLYEFLLGDIAVQRGRPELGAQAYLDLARKTRDPRVAKRAAQLAYESRQMEIAVAAFKLWQELEPGSSLAKQMLLSLLLSGGKLDEAQSLLATILKAEPASAPRTFMSVYQILARSPDKQAVLDWMVAATKAYPDVAEGHWVVAQAAYAAGNIAMAQTEAHRAVTLKPEWEGATALEAELYLPTDPTKGLAMLKQFLERYPDGHELRLFYARALLNQKQFQLAREQFQRLLQERPDSADLAFAIALISMQMGEFDRAEQELQRALDKGGKEVGTVHFYLAQLSEARQDDAKALEHYRMVREGESAYAARLREVALLDKAGKLEEARAALRQAQPKNDQQRVQLLLIDAQLLREGKQHEQSLQVLSQGLEKFPDHPDLLYQAAMAADKLKRNALFEQTIRKLIKLAPDNAHAYNALGYSLLERKERVQEAMQLVEKAYQLAPNDAAIIDSMGWGYYRQGNLVESLAFLKRAYEANADPEIAAHLGEVLWVSGDKEAARKIWSDSSKEYPENEALQAVIKRFLP